MKDLKHPADPLYQIESDVNVAVLSNEETDEEDYHIGTMRLRENLKKSFLKHFFSFYSRGFLR